MTGKTFLFRILPLLLLSVFLAVPHGARALVPCNQSGQQCTRNIGDCRDLGGASSGEQCDGTTGSQQKYWTCCVVQTPPSGSCPTGSACARTSFCPSATKQTGTCGPGNSQACCQPTDGNPSAPSACPTGSDCATGSSCPSGATQTGVCGENNSKACCKPSSNPSSPPGTGGPSYGTGGPVNVVFDNPLEYDTVQGVVGSLLDYLQGIIVLLAIVFIVIGAVLYVTSGGNETRIKAAKKAVLAALIGLAVGIAAPTFLKEIAIILDWGESENLPPDVSASIRLAEILSNVLSFLLGIIGVLALIMLVVGGIMYLFSAGDEKRAAAGKRIATYAVIGIAVTLAALVLVRQIAAFFT